MNVMVGCQKHAVLEGSIHLPNADSVDGRRWSTHGSPSHVNRNQITRVRVDDSTAASSKLAAVAAGTTALLGCRASPDEHNHPTLPGIRRASDATPSITIRWVVLGYRMNRRAYLASGLVATIGGCMDGSDGDATDDDSSDDVEHEATEPVEPESGETVDDFSDIDAWELVAGAVAREEDRAVVGDSCARLENREGDEQARIAYEFDEPLDCRRHSPGLAIAADEPMAPLLQLFDDDGGHVTFRATVEADVELLRAPFGIEHADDVDLGAITGLEIAHVAAEDAEQQLWVDDLHFVPRPETGVVTLQFDGGHESVYENGLPLTEEYGYPATAFVPTGRIREEADHDGEALAEPQLEELDDAGWTIASHTARSRPLTDLEDDERIEELEDAVEWLESEGYDDGTRYIAYPSGRYDQAGLEAVREVHELGFVGRYPCQGEPADPLLCSRVLEPEPDELEEILERAVAYGGITALGWVRLEDDSLESFETAMEILSELEPEGDLEVVSPGELEAEYVR